MRFQLRREILNGVGKEGKLTYATTILGTG